MQTTYDAITTEARNYLMQSKSLKTAEDITYGILVINDLLGLERTEEIIDSEINYNTRASNKEKLL